MTLNPGWQVVQVPLPAEALQPGENNLTLTFAQSGAFTTGDGSSVKAAAAVQWIQVGGTVAPPGFEPPKLSEGNKLVIPAGGTFSARDTHFRVSYAASDATLARGIEILRRLAKGG